MTLNLTRTEAETILAVSKSQIECERDWITSCPEKDLAFFKQEIRNWLSLRRKLKYILKRGHR